MRAIDLTGQVFGRWTVVARAENSASGQCRWLCRCACGNENVVASATLRYRDSPKCKDCWRSAVSAELRERNVTHGLSARAEYRVLNGVRRRCRNPRHVAYSYYGGRGIEYRLPEDLGEATRSLIEAIGERPEGTSLDRIDNDGHYELGNLRWATWSQQMRNRRPVVA